MNSYFSQLTGIRITHYLDLEDILGTQEYEFLEKSKVLAAENFIKEDFYTVSFEVMIGSEMDIWIDAGSGDNV